MPRARIPSVAIVGRPNVGKSSLLNRLVGRRVSIVDPTPGVTRDRIGVEIEIDPPTETPRGTPSITCEIFDTGGYGVYMAEGKRYDDVGADLSTLTKDIERQIGLAIDNADLILFLLDAHDGVTALDRTIAKLLRQKNATKKVLSVANKVDGEKWIAHGVEAAGLGFGEPIGVSAENGFNIRQLRETLYEKLWPIALAESKPGEDDDTNDSKSGGAEVKVAIVGKRNSGKSTLINAWAGEERVIVSEIAGTTRDSVDVRLEIDGRALIAIDTAGLRKRKSFADDVEFYAYGRMIDAIKRCDVALLLLDASAEVSQVDQKLAQELQEHFKPTVIVVNKWDLAEKKGLKTGDYGEYLLQQLRGLDYAPIAFVSATEESGLQDLLAMAFNLHQQASHRETTGRLNTAIREIMEQRGPSSKAGARAKVYFVSQVTVQPPTIVLSVNKPALFHGQYERYLLGQMRERLPFAEVPIKLLFRERERMPLEELKRRKPRESGVGRDADSPRKTRRPQRKKKPAKGRAR
ncbi:MAG TPA: ribosome biogenesis GTPase Der [Phycisphaerales bacterium]|nr:ribosome biogenesis GTPase Der [Phycisphaerales bacterium]